jgi:uroporphyrinogen III methyltransferase/synthase
MMNNGYVYLIGAGPGDPGLITVRGRDCISRAEVVIYDYLANERLLDFAPAGAERIYAGKVGGAHHHEQALINELLVAKALQGKVVARLKGGDPFIFGRGGEECAALAALNIPFEIVPGITAAVGAAAYAGIPLTHRGIATSVAFVTGHESPDKVSSQIDWQSLALQNGTLVFYMGVRNLPQIVSGLISHGRPAETPVALIRWGTHPDQEVLTGTLANIVGKVHATGFRAPAVTLVGNVVEMRNHLRWFDNRALSGRGVLVTRAADQAGEFTELLEAHGARTYEAPTIAIIPPDCYDELDAAIKRLSGFGWAVFSSVNAVTFFFNRLIALGHDSRSFGSCRVCAVGPKTAAALAAHGILADLVPADYKAEGVVAAFTTITLDGISVLFPRADRARDVIPAGLARLGATVTAPVAYCNKVPDNLDRSVIAALEERRIDCVTFTASSTVSNLAGILGENRFLNLFSGVTVASIGPITSRTCRELGLSVTIEPDSSTLVALTAAIVNFYQTTVPAPAAPG